jgi:uncharacterized oligopeptide transporter (OPT) family protein
MSDTDSRDPRQPGSPHQPGQTTPGINPDAMADPPAPGSSTPLPPANPPEHATGLFDPRYREVTIASIVFGVVVGAIMNAAITYAGLKIGFTIVGSAIAAVLGFGVLRGILRKGTILETNIGQTIASAVNTPNSGVIFTVPVLYLLGYSLSPTGLDFWLITLACVAGAILGCAFIIPLRKQMIDIDRLRFPSPTGVAVILKSPGAGAAKSIVLIAGIALGALIYLPVGLPDLGGPGYGTIGWTLPAETLPDAAAAPVADGAEQASSLTIRVDRDRDGAPDPILTHSSVDVGRFLGLPDQFQLVFAIAPFAIGAGFITGRAGLMVLAGGILAYFIINPLVFSMGWAPETVRAHEAPGYAFGAFNRPLGIGLLLGGALMGVVFALPAIREAMKSIAGASFGKMKGGSDELGMKVLIISVLAALLLLFLAADFVGNKPVNKADPVSAVELTGEGAPADRAKTDYKGYTLAFASQQTLDAWDNDWTTEQRDRYMAANNLKPGWLSWMNPHLRALTIALVGAAWIWFAGIIIAQCTGMTDWSPISGMALLTVVLVLLLAGSGAVVGAVLLGAALCVAITCAADMMGDLRPATSWAASPSASRSSRSLRPAWGPSSACWCWPPSWPSTRTSWACRWARARQPPPRRPRRSRRSSPACRAARCPTPSMAWAPCSALYWAWARSRAWACL